MMNVLIFHKAICHKQLCINNTITAYHDVNIKTNEFPLFLYKIITIDPFFSLAWSVKNGQHHSDSISQQRQQQQE